MLRSSLALWAPVARSAGAAPFARALLTGRVSEARVDAYFFDQSRSADADASPYLNRRDARVAALREAYGLGDGGKNAAAMARPVAKDLRPFSAPAAGDAAEASAALTLVLDALVQHSKSTAEFGKWLADTEAMQQVLSRLASSIFALDAAAMAVDAAKDVAPEAHEGESALLAVVARRILERRVGDAVSVMNPSCVFAPDAAPSMPARFQAVQHVAAGFKTLSGANAHPLEAAAISALVADAAQAATAAPGPNSMIGAVRGNRAFYEERAAREFPVNMYLKLNAVQLCDDVCAFRNAVVDSRAKVLLGDKANAAATGAVAAICSELFAATAALLRGSASVDVDETAGYPAALKAQVFLEESRHARIADLALHKMLGTGAVRLWPGEVPVTPPAELPAPKQAQPSAKPAAAEEQPPKKDE